MADPQAPGGLSVPAGRNSRAGGWLWLVAVSLTLMMLAAIAALPARASRAQSKVALPEGQAWYVHQRGVYVDSALLEGNVTIAWRSNQQHQQWITCDGRPHYITNDQPIGFMSSADRQGWIAAGRPQLAYRFNFSQQSPTPFYFFGDWATCQQVAAMPTSVSGVRRLIGQQSAGSGLAPAYRDLDAIAETLPGVPFSRAQRLAVLRAAKQIPGIRYEGRVDDHAGRPGLAFAAYDRGEDHGYGLEIVIDPASGRLLGRTDTTLRDLPLLHLHAGDVTGWTVILSSRAASYR
jgi:hypothetical protein